MLYDAENDANFGKASILTQVMNTFKADGAESTISHNGKIKSIGSEWDTLKKNVIVYTGDVIKIATATWKKYWKFLESMYKHQAAGIPLL